MKTKSSDGRAVFSWTLYDWANSAFATTVVATVYPIYYTGVVSSHLPAHIATSNWGLITAAALVLVAGLGPVLGAMADFNGRKKRFLLLFVALGVAATALLYFVRSGDVLMGALIFILAQLGFSGAIIFYDSLLPHIAPPEDIDRISSRGYAMGYAGGGLLLAVNLWMIQTAPAGQVEHITRLVFLTVAAWWLIFTLPLAFFVPEPARRVLPHELRYNPVQASLGRLRNTFSEIGKYRELSKFIFAFWLYNNGIGTIITMATAYGTELGFAQTTLIGTLLMVQFVAIPFSLLFGWLAKRLGVKQSILLSIAIYSLIAIAGYFLTQEWHFWALGFAVATVQGGSQALSRSLFGRLAPPSRSAEFFSFFSISEKIAGAAGPLVFALVGRWMGGSRLSIVSLILFFIAGGLLLSRVNVEEGIRVAESEEAGLVSQAVPLAGAD